MKKNKNLYSSYMTWEEEKCFFFKQEMIFIIFCLLLLIFIHISAASYETVRKNILANPKTTYQVVNDLLK
jgi:Tfp pilus assembly protein PilZ